MTNALLERYDIFYRNSASQELGFLLARTSKGPKAWQRTDSSPLPDSYPTGEISYANLSPDVQKVISQRYMHGGLGALEFEVEDDADFQILRYLKSQNVDNRCKGKSYPGPKIVSITMPQFTTLAITNADMELDSNWTIESGATASRSSDKNHTAGGTYSWKLDNNTVVYQDLLTEIGRAHV